MAAAQDLSSLDKDPRLFLYTSLTAGSSHIITATSRMETILKANKIPFQAIDTATDEKARRLWQRRAGGRKLPGLVKEGFVIGDLNEVEEWNEFGELKDNIGPVPANNVAPVGGQVGVSTAPVLSHNVSPASASTKSIPVTKVPQPVFDKSKAIALPGAAEIAARNKAASPTTLGAINLETKTSSPEDKKSSVEAVKKPAAKAEAPKSEDANPEPQKSEAAKSEAAVPEASEPKATKSEEKKPEDIKPEPEAAKDVPKSHPALDHLSAPASAIQSGTATPAQTEEPATPATATNQHRGSGIVEAPTEEIKKVERQNSLQEVEDEDAEEATKAVESLKVGGSEKQDIKTEEKDKDEEKEEVTEKTQDQKAKEPMAAGKSVED